MKLDKPIVFFDLETTGVNTSKDRIVQIALIKIYPNGEQEQKSTLINPTIPIPAGATEVHGITDEMVKDAPTFSQIAKSLLEQIGGCDLGGYNSDSFDVPLLIEEFSRASIEYPREGDNINFVDALRFERLLNSHKLTDTYKRYTGKDLEGAHDALNDVVATAEVVLSQIEKYGQELTPKEIDELCQGDKKRHDYAGKLYEVDGEVYWNFGKHQDQKVADTIQYASWVLSADFPKDTKNRITKIIKSE